MPNLSPDIPSGVRLAELMGALSIATDLGMGQPLEFALHSCVVALRLGEQLGLDVQDLRAVYYQSLLRYIGCNFETRLLAAVFGDELLLRKDFIHVDTTSFDFFRQMTAAIRSSHETLPPVQVLWSITRGFVEAARFSKEFYESHCEIAERLAERLGFETTIATAIKQVYARWDGKGVPNIKGEAIAPGMLIVSLAQDAVYAFQLGGTDAALNLVRQRKGSLYAPKHVEVFSHHAEELLAGSDLNWAGVMDLEPGVHKVLSESEFDTACEVIADFTDLKSPYLLGHSPGVARVALSVARQFGLPEADILQIRRVGLLHDIGRVGVSAGIWGKQTPLSERDWEAIRLHPYHTERILARSPVLNAIGQIASMHHERLDGSGYHRGATSPILKSMARIVAVADVYQALTEPRPYRPALSAEEASIVVVNEARANRLDGDVVNSLLAAVGQLPSPRKIFPGGLSEREVEVVRLVARGQSIKEIAQSLTITPKTADSHIQHIYNKIGVNTRAGATLYALENRLL